MSKYTKYRLYQKYETRGSQEAIPVYPNTFSIDGDGTMPLVIVEENSRDCGYTGDTQPIYRWYNMPIDKYYVCDECAANFKIKAVYTGGMTYSAACDNSTELTSGDTKPSGYEFTAMTSVEIGNCITSIGNRAFGGCSGLTSVTIPNSVTSIGSDVFSYCISLTSIDIPNSVTSIGNYAFRDCSGLTSCTIGSGVTSIGDMTFWRCESLTSIDIPDSVTSIGKSAFDNCSGLTSVVIPSGVTSISNFTFAYCYSLTSCTIGSGVTSIGHDAFYICSGLTSIDIPSGVTSIGDRTFYRCTSLSSITVNAIAPPTLGSNVFNGSTCPIYVPSQSVNAYKSASGWSDYASRIQAIP